METFTATAKQRNLDQQAGFYVDRSGEEVASPLEIPAYDFANAIRHTAKVVQMHLCTRITFASRTRRTAR